MGENIVRWLVSQGARNLIVLSRKGGDSTIVRTFLKELAQLNVTVFAPKCDVGNEDRVKTVLEQAALEMPPIKGCIHASMILQVSHDHDQK